MTRGKGSPGMLPRRAVLAAGAALVASPAAWAQEAGRNYRVGFVSTVPRDLSGYHPLLIEELGHAGFVEGRNLSIVGDFSASDHADAAAATVVKANPDVIYAGGPVLIRAVQRATKTIPILANSYDLLGEQLVPSLAHPGGNTTGLSLLMPELNSKRLGILIELLPGATRLAALVDPGATDLARFQALAEAVGSRGVTLSIHRADRAEDIVPAIEAAREGGAQALSVTGSALFGNNVKRIIEHVAQVQLPTIYEYPGHATAGGLVAYGPPVATIVRRHLAPMMIKLLRGTKPADIPVEQPSVFELVINLKTTKAMDLTVPTSLLLRVDRVIE